MNPTPTSGHFFSFLSRRWEIVAAALVVSIGWAYWTHQPSSPIHTSRLELKWDDPGPGHAAFLLQQAESPTIVRTMGELEAFLSSPEFLTAAAGAAAVDWMEKVPTLGGRAIWAAFDRGPEEAAADLSAFEPIRDEDAGVLSLVFRGSSAEAADSLAEAMARTLRTSQAAASNRLAFQIRDGVRDRLARWPERETRSTRALWTLRGNSHVASAGRVAPRPGGPSPNEIVFPIAPIEAGETDVSSILAGFGLNENTNADGFPADQPELKTSLLHLHETLRLEGELESLERELDALATRLDAALSDDASLATWLSELTEVETRLIDLRQSRRTHEETFRTFDHGFTLGDGDRPSGGVLAHTVPAVESQTDPDRFRHYAVWAVYGAVVGVLFAKWLDGLLVPVGAEG